MRPNDGSLHTGSQIEEMVGSNFFLMVASAHNSYILAKDSDYAVTKAKYPTCKTFIKDMSEGLVGDTRVDCADSLENRGRRSP